MNDPNTAELTVGVVGAGAMGQGIVQVSLTGGMAVRLHDARPGGAEAGRDAVFARIDRLVEKGRLDEAGAEAAKGRLTLIDGIAGLAGCDVVIEAVFEDLQLKRKLFAEIEETVSDDCLIASNTSSILIASIASAARKRDRIAGLHFFNPVPLMKLVEVVRGPETSQATVDALVALGKRMGRVPVVARDAPGFLVNHGGRAFTTEGIRLLHERVATPAEIDAVMRDCCGYRMGPCELMDLTGIDVNLPVTDIIHEGFSQDPRLKTFFPHRALFEAGRHGRKTRAGHYDYDEAGRIAGAPSPDHASDAAPAKAVALAGPDAALKAFAEGLGATVLDADDGTSPILAAPVGEDCATLAHRTGADYRRLVAVDLVFLSEARATIMTPPGADPKARDAVAALIARAGRKVTAIKDSPGFVAQRIQAMIANLGAEMAQIGVAAPEEIDTAMELGLNYPKGPLALADAVGPDRIMAILAAMQDITGEDRYRTSLWLRRRALLGLGAHVPD